MVCLYFKVQIGVNGLQGVVVLVVFQLDIAVGVRQGEEEIGVFLGQALFIVINCCGFVLQDGGIVVWASFFPVSSASESAFSCAISPVASS
ncbi:MAG: hypothetical protein V8S89_03220 [Oscillospiraceae bacterium]